MLDQNTFIETVQSVAEIIRTSAEPIEYDKGNDRKSLKIRDF